MILFLGEITKDVQQDVLLDYTYNLRNLQITLSIYFMLILKQLLLLLTLTTPSWV